jgi:hypothetical protein
MRAWEVFSLVFSYFISFQCLPAVFQLRSKFFLAANIHFILKTKISNLSTEFFIFHWAMCAWGTCRYIIILTNVVQISWFKFKFRRIRKCFWIFLFFDTSSKMVCWEDTCHMSVYWLKMYKFHIG